jgi:hypothetical protein
MFYHHVQNDGGFTVNSTTGNTFKISFCGGKVWNRNELELYFVTYIHK